MKLTDFQSIAIEIENETTNYLNLFNFSDEFQKKPPLHKIY